MDKLLILDALQVVKQLTRNWTDISSEHAYQAFTVADYLAECVRSEPRPGCTSTYHEMYVARLKDYLLEIQVG